MCVFVFVCLCELLAAHDKSPPVCGISVAVHVGARPDPTAYHLPPEALLEWMTDWWENLTWQKASLIDQGSSEHLRGAQRAKDCGAPFLSLSTWLPGAYSLVHGYVWSAPELPVCTQATTNCITPTYKHIKYFQGSEKLIKTLNH